MPRKKQSAPVEHRLTNKELDAELQKVKFRSKKGKAIFDQITKQTWFRQYARGSNDAKNKIIKKVRKGINHGKYTYMSREDYEKEESQGKEKLTKQQKKSQKKGKQVIQKQQKTQKKVERKQREKIKINERKAPSGRKYSSTEIHEGIHSKRAKEYRKKHGIKENDV